ncbi:MAG: efflux RND transporter permease subunit, partial [Candidatus Aenigmarchaeota archaeon]|nr:efflux RND transporter permease subunit [Candidatus Aenigmarchaeota archaeon]
NLPEGASFARTDEVTKKIENKLIKTKGIQRVISFTGLGGSNQAKIVSQLDDWNERKTKDLSLQGLLGKINGMFSGMPDANIFTISPPSIPGLGWFGGFQIELQDRGDNSRQYLLEEAEKLITAANQNKKIARLFTSYQANLPQILVEVDTEKALAQNVQLNEIYNTLNGQFGTYYVNDFNKLGRIFRVQMQADSRFRETPEDINKLYVRNIQGEMTPLNTMISIKHTVGPQSLNRFNMFRSVTLNGMTGKGYSSGQAILEMEKITKETLSDDMSYEWSGSTRQEVESKGQILIIISLALIFVYLFLVALYESWSIPFAVMLISPVAAIGGFLALYISGHEFNLYSPIGLIMLIGLATKHAILIVEFAKKEREKGTSIVNSALKAAGLRF